MAPPFQAYEYGVRVVSSCVKSTTGTLYVRLRYRMSRRLAKQIIPRVLARESGQSSDNIGIYAMQFRETQRLQTEDELFVPTSLTSEVKHELIPGVPGACLLNNVLTEAECDTLVDFSERCGYTQDTPVSLGRDVRQNDACVFIAEADLSGMLYMLNKPLYMLTRVNIFQDVYPHAPSLHTPHIYYPSIPHTSRIYCPFLIPTLAYFFAHLFPAFSWGAGGGDRCDLSTMSYASPTPRAGYLAASQRCRPSGLSLRPEQPLAPVPLLSH